jgi:energy-coupling factor transporter ATP-binding protein EcfA2
MLLQATNFQAWPHFELEVEGLTVIVGDSNLGKSAIFRALRGVLRNDISVSRVRHGENVCTVSCSYEGVNATITRPRKGTVSYTVNGVDYSRLAKEVPKEVRALNFEPVEIGTARLDPIFASQFGSQFLLESSPAELGQVLGAFASTEKLERGRKLLRQMVTDTDKEAKTLAEIIGRQQDEAAAVEIKVDAVRAVEDRLEQLDAIASTKMPVHELLSRVLVASAELKKLQPLASIKIPTLEKARILDNALAAADVAASASDLATKAKRILKGIEQIPSPSKATKLRKALAASDVATSASDIARDAKRILKRIELVMEVRDRACNRYKALAASTTLLEYEAVDVRTLTAAFDKHLQPRDKSKTLSRALALVDVVAEASLSRSQSIKCATDTETELEAINSERDQIHKELAASQVTCPECGTKFVPE